MNTLANIIGWVVIVIACGLAAMSALSRLLDWWEGWRWPSGRRPRP